MASSRQLLWSICAYQIPLLYMLLAHLIIPHLSSSVDTFIAHSLQANIIIFSNHVSDLSMMTASRSLSAAPSASTCLTDCFLLWGAHFSPHATLHALKPHFLARARVALPLLLSTPLGVAPEFQQLSKNGDKEAPGDKRYNVMVAICASSMLATYFFSEGRPIEGSYHANTASQLAICAGLHRSPDPRGWRGGSGRRALSDPSGYQGQNAGMDMPLSPAPSQSSSELLPPPSNQSHALERQHLFWTVFALDRGWSAAAKLPAPSWRSSADAASGSDVLREKDPRTSISTPWPEDWGLLLVCPLKPRIYCERRLTVPSSLTITLETDLVLLFLALGLLWKTLLLVLMYGPPSLSFSYEQRVQPYSKPRRASRLFETHVRPYHCKSLILSIC